MSEIRFVDNKPIRISKYYNIINYCFAIICIIREKKKKHSYIKKISLDNTIYTSTINNLTDR